MSPSLLPSALLHVLHLFLHRSVLYLDEVLLLVLCSGVASFCVDDGRVGVGGVVRALGLVGQIRSCGRRERKKKKRGTDSKREKERGREKGGRSNKIAEAIKVKHWNCKMEL